MHIPDGFLDAKTAIAAASVSALGLGLALRHVKRTFPRSRVPLIGLAAAFIFAAQMVNFPIAGGTSGHIIGGVLAAVLLGPHAAILVMGCVIGLQCLLFADGGVTALGANIFNMGILAPLTGYAVYRLIQRVGGLGLRTRLVATALAAWISVVAAAISCVGQLALSGLVKWQLAFPVMADVHMLIGLGEALITTCVVYAVSVTRPELLLQNVAAGSRPRVRDFAGYGLLVSAGLLIFVAPFASPWPDGLERVAESLGFGSRSAAPVLSSPLRDYAIPGLDSAVGSTILAGLIGLIVVFGLAYWLARKLAASDA